MKLLKRGIYNNEIFVSTAKWIERYNDKKIIRLSTENILQYNNIHIGDVVYYSDLYCDVFLGSSEIQKVFNGEIELFNKAIVVDKMLRLTLTSFSDYRALPVITIKKENGNVAYYSLYGLYSKNSMKVQTKNSLKYNKQCYWRELRSCNKGTKRYAKIEKIIQGIDNLINNLDKLFI